MSVPVSHTGVTGGGVTAALLFYLFRRWRSNAILPIEFDEVARHVVAGSLHGLAEERPHGRHHGCVDRRLSIIVTMHQALGSLGLHFGFFFAWAEKPDEEGQDQESGIWVLGRNAARAETLEQQMETPLAKAVRRTRVGFAVEELRRDGHVDRRRRVLDGKVERRMPILVSRLETYAGLDEAPEWGLDVGSDDDALSPATRAGAIGVQGDRSAVTDDGRKEVCTRSAWLGARFRLKVKDIRVVVEKSEQADFQPIGAGSCRGIGACKRIENDSLAAVAESEIISRVSCMRWIGVGKGGRISPGFACHIGTLHTYPGL